MPEVVGQSVEVWENKVLDFLAENEELANDSTVGKATLQRLLLNTTNLLVPLMNEVTEAANSYAGASNRLADAIRDPHCSAGKLHKREQENESLKARYEALLRWQEELDAFRVKVHAKWESKTSSTEVAEDIRQADCPDFTTGGTGDTVTFTAKEEPPKPSLWRRLFGG